MLLSRRRRHEDTARDKPAKLTKTVKKKAKKATKKLRKGEPLPQ